VAAYEEVTSSFSYAFRFYGTGKPRHTGWKFQSSQLHRRAVPDAVAGKRLRVHEEADVRGTLCVLRPVKVLYRPHAYASRDIRPIDSPLTKVRPKTA
jgi:hypothetical protein